MSTNQNLKRHLDRRIVLVDIEQLVEGPAALNWAVEQRHDGLQALYPEGSDCLYEVAYSHWAARTMRFAFPGGRHRWRSGPDGADLALLDVVHTELLHRRFGEAVIASGDRIFVEAVALLHSHGISCTVVADPAHLSRRLRMIADNIVELPPMGGHVLDLRTAS